MVTWCGLHRDRTGRAQVASAVHRAQAPLATGAPPPEPRTASAAMKPARTALSIVAGQPVRTQSPATSRRGTGLTVHGRSASAPGAGEKVAFGSLITADRTTFAS